MPCAVPSTCVVGDQSPVKGLESSCWKKCTQRCVAGLPSMARFLVPARHPAMAQDSTVACRTALVNAMRQTLQRADCEPDRIGHIHAHGLGTVTSDIAEAQAISQVLGDFARQNSTCGRQESACECRSWFWNSGTDCQPAGTATWSLVSSAQLQRTRSGVSRAAGQKLR